MPFCASFSLNSVQKFHITDSRVRGEKSNEFQATA